MSDVTPPPPVSNERKPRVDNKDKPSRERKTPFAISQAQLDIEAAERELEAAKESGSKSRIDAAEKDLTKKREVLTDLRKGPKSERREARREQAAEYYERLGPYIVGLVRNVPELRDTVQEAIANGWNVEKFLRDRRVVDWLGTKGEDAKRAIRIEFDPARKQEWENLLRDAKNAVKDLAKQTYNLDITEEQLDRLARRYVYEGWEGNPRGLQVWMAERVEKGGQRTETVTGGTIESYQRDLQGLARRFGLEYTPDWYQRQATNLLNPDSGVTNEKLVNDMIREAESLYPVFSGRLSADYGVRDAANSYLAQMSRLLEIDPESIELNDPLLTRAFGSAQEANGSPKLMSLWDFQKSIRADERWQNTLDATQTYDSIGMQLGKAMGFVS